MAIRQFMGAAAFGILSVIPTGASAAAPSQSGCIFREHHVSAVRPYKVDEHIGRATIERLRGAELYVPAEPGLTAEWLRLTLQRHLSQMSATGMADCPLDLKDIHVRVDSAGPGFWVTIAANDTGQAQEVLRRAQRLVR